ncbi:hypothetical protein HHI36_021399 [Cryptolaemus montrouzieri]|uniref:RNA helicase n=1 Tax=Cryptolaemus montrouzieri TaxID=559131 RepID=A0ABD2MWT4_9CUCU
MNTKKNLLKNSVKNESDSKIDGIVIEKPTCLKLEKLKEIYKFSMIIRNNLSDDVKITKVEFPKTNSQCRILSVVENFLLKSGEILEVQCECTSMHMGKSQEYFLVLTEKGEVNEWIDILVESNSRQTYGNYQKRNTNYKYQMNGNIVKGERIAAPPRFIAVKCLNYTLPKRLFDVVTKYTNSFLDVALLKEDLSLIKPCLSENLTFNNYLDKFHTLLYLEEIQHVIEMSSYDQDYAVFIPNNEFLMLEIENLSERRPSIIVGDKIIAKDSYGHSTTEWEGFVHKTGAKHVYLKFSPVFHDTYNGEDYQIHVVASRSAIRRLHQAVDLSVKNLGGELLFPSKIKVKEPQVKFSLNGVSKSSNNGCRKEMLKKIMEYNSKSPLEKEEYKEQVLKQSEENMLKLEWYNETLNRYQKEAVKNVLLGETRPMPYIIFGPPGTGKTVTLVECILQILRLIPSSRLLVTAPSNSAADLIALRLIETGVLKPGDLVRYVSFSYVSSVPEALAPFSTTGDLSIEGTNTRAPRILQNGLTLGSTVSVLGRHRITVSTCSSAGALYAMGFPKGHFSHILIDEAGQAMEPEIMIPLVFLDSSTGQAVLAGDPLQLGPVVLSKLSEECGLYESYVERLLNRFPYVRDPIGFPDTGGYDPRFITKLLCNYRSLPSLLKLTSTLFYNDDLIPMLSDEDGGSEAVVLLEKLREILVTDDSIKKLPNIVFHGINGENFQTPDSPSWFNPSEASQVFFYINELYRLGLKAGDIGVISPYVKQVKEIRSLLNEAEFELPRIGSVEEFQGQEFNIVILSTVRSSQEYINSDIKHSLGFVSSPRRLNVALSRAKILLIIVGNPNLLYGDKYWQSVINYVVKEGNFIGCPLIFE